MREFSAYGVFKRGLKKKKKVTQRFKLDEQTKDKKIAKFYLAFSDATLRLYMKEVLD